MCNERLTAHEHPRVTVRKGRLTLCTRSAINPSKKSQKRLHRYALINKPTNHTYWLPRLHRESSFRIRLPSLSKCLTNARSEIGGSSISSFRLRSRRRRRRHHTQPMSTIATNITAAQITMNMIAPRLSQAISTHFSGLDGCACPIVKMNVSSLADIVLYVVIAVRLFCSRISSSDGASRMVTLTHSSQ